MSFPSVPPINFLPDTYGLLDIILFIWSYEVVFSLLGILFVFPSYTSMLVFYLSLLLLSRFPRRSLFAADVLVHPSFFSSPSVLLYSGMFVPIKFSFIF